jgi:zinc/manganese transport system substrate-binding protein
MKTKVLLLVALLAWATGAEAATRIVATTPAMGMLARTVGADHVSVTVLSPPDRDAHYLLATPSMMIALRRADLLVAVGAELEIGWLPAALQGANNGKVLPGQAGYFEGAAQVELIETGQAADRSRGDVHPLGNPHYYMDPQRMAQVARALAARLAQMDPANAAAFNANAAAFGRLVDERVPRWKSKAQRAPGVVFYHKDGNYLAALLGVPVLGFVEPLPGIPPTASHLRDMVQRLKGKEGVILFNSFHPEGGPEFLARNLGWKAQRLSHDVGLKADAAMYLDHIEQWVNAIAGTSAP